MLRKMRDEWGYGSATELKLWGRGVDMNIFSPERRSQKFRASKGISEGDVVILWVGRLVPEKRPDIWMGVVKRLQDEGLPVKALVVGSGTFERYLTTLKHATCCGWLSGAALGECLLFCYCCSVYIQRRENWRFRMPDKHFPPSQRAITCEFFTQPPY